MDTTNDGGRARAHAKCRRALLSGIVLAFLGSTLGKLGPLIAPAGCPEFVWDACWGIGFAGAAFGIGVASAWRHWAAVVNGGTDDGRTRHGPVTEP